MADFIYQNQFLDSRSKHEPESVSSKSKSGEDVISVHKEVMTRAETSYDFDKMTKFTAEMSREEIFKKIMGSAYNAAAVSAT